MSTARAVEQGADAVAVAREQPRQHADELARHAALGDGRRSRSRRCALRSTQEPGGQLAVFGELAHVGLLQPRGDVPVDVAHVVVVLVLAQVGQVEAGAAQQRAVVALQQAVEAADHRPLEAPQQRLRAPARADPAAPRRRQPQFCPAPDSWVASGLSGSGDLLHHLR